MTSTSDLLATARRLQPLYSNVAEIVARELERIVERLGLSDSSVSARAKAASHTVIKIEKKVREGREDYRNDPFGVMPDLAGARVVVPLLSDVRAVCAELDRVFEVLEEDTKIKGLGHDRLGYLAVHCQVQLTAGQVGGSEKPLPDRSVCEIQLHTIAQHAWSTVSHDLMYKPVGIDPPMAIRRRVTRAVSLVELFDEQIEEARRVMASDPHYTPAVMLDVLTKAALAWRPPEGSDPELSLEILGLLQRTYSPEDISRFGEIINRFLDAYGERLAIFQRQHPELDLLTQPEIAALFERIVEGPQLLRAEWIKSTLPNELLDETAAALGRPYQIGG